jgi:hypothetical protein
MRLKDTLAQVWTTLVHGLNELSRGLLQLK